MKNCKVISIIITASLLTFTIGFGGGMYYEARENVIYIFDQERFIKLVAMGVALESPSYKKSKKAMSDPDGNSKESLQHKMKMLKKVISKDYKHYPMIITPLTQNRIPKGYYGIYGNPKKVDITEDLIIKVIGEKRWEEIGATFLK